LSTSYPVPRYNSPSTGGWTASRRRPSSQGYGGRGRAPNATPPRRRTASEINEASARGRTRYATQQRDSSRRRKTDRAKLLAELQAALSKGGAGAGVFGGLPGPQTMGPPPRVPLAPTAGNQYAGVEQAVAAQTRDSQQYLAAQGKGTRAQLAANGGGGLLERGAGTFASQLSQQLGAFAAEAGALRNQASAAYATDELRRRGELAKNRFEQQTQQYKAMQEGGGDLSLSMVQALAAQGLDPMQFAGNPIAGAIVLGRLQYARSGEMNGITASQVAQLAQLGLDYRQFGSGIEAAEAIGQARRGLYGSTDLARQFMAFVGSP